MEKKNMLNRLTLVINQIQQQEQQALYQIKAIHLLRKNFFQQIFQAISKKRACILIQKTWRGFHTRILFAILLKKHQEYQRQMLLQQRLQKAYQILCHPTKKEIEKKQMVLKRMEARKEKYFMTLEEKEEDKEKCSIFHSSKKEEGSHCCFPPRVSTTTGGRTKCVPFKTFQAIRTVNAQVNPHNVWVSIPVLFQEKNTINTTSINTTTSSITSKTTTTNTPNTHSSPLRPLRLIEKKPLTVSTPGRIRSRKTDGKYYYDTQFDWVPATLLDGGRMNSPTLKERYERTSPWRKNRRPSSSLSPLQATTKLPSTTTGINHPPLSYY
jgi:hypothetical protein